MPEKLDAMIREAAALVKAAKWDSFAIATAMPKEWLAKEEEEWDSLLDSGSRSLKDSVNGQIVKGLARATGKKYDPLNGDGKITFDFASNRVSAGPEAIFVFGRYMKYEAGLSQSRWICPKCNGEGCFKCDWKGKYYESVEELIGDPFKKKTGAANYALHASGREDIDVTNTAGRPFVLEIIKPKSRKLDLKAIATGINKGKRIGVSGLKLVPRGSVELVTESHFDKEYEAEVEFSAAPPQLALKSILSLEGGIITQRTPKRVAHRRADLFRKRKIISVVLLGHSGTRATFRILAEAGTYIKELVDGDGGRTEPNFAKVAGLEAKCKSLRVVGIYDEFLTVSAGL